MSQSQIDFGDKGPHHSSSPQISRLIVNPSVHAYKVFSLAKKKSLNPRRFAFGYSDKVKSNS